MFAAGRGSGASTPVATGEGGFRDLLEQGLCYRDAHFQHSMTFTASGHATLATGGHPGTVYRWEASSGRVNLQRASLEVLAQLHQRTYNREPATAG